MVFAAASLSDAMTDVAATWDGEVLFNFAGSNVLATQIEATDVAEVFVSADIAWMDRLEEGGKIVAGSRRVLLSNTLVIVANAAVELAADSPNVLLDPSIRYVSMGDPDAVPAGRYGKAWLKSEGLWDKVGAKVAPAADARAAMRLVEADPEVLGVVYATDALASDQVRVLFKAANGPQIRYPAALVEKASTCPSAGSFLDHLEVADAVFHKHGFGTP